MGDRVMISRTVALKLKEIIPSRPARHRVWRAKGAPLIVHRQGRARTEFDSIELMKRLMENQNG